MRKQQGCVELCLQRDDLTAESLCISRAQTGVADIVMGVCYRLPHQEESVRDAFFKQLEEASCLQDVVLRGNLTTLISTGRAIQHCTSITQEVSGVHR